MVKNKLWDFSRFTHLSHPLAPLIQNMVFGIPSACMCVWVHEHLTGAWMNDLTDVSRFQRVLTMVQDTQNHWVSGLCPSCGIPKSTTHNVSELDPDSWYSVLKNLSITGQCSVIMDILAPKTDGLQSSPQKTKMETFSKTALTNSMSWALLERPSVVKPLNSFMEPEGSSPNSQEPSSCPHPEPD
jgi:hypothetical protein